MLSLTSAASLGPLAERLAAVLATPADDPFTPDWVAVPSAGDWTAAMLAHVATCVGVVPRTRTCRGVLANRLP